jgi:hypothetical protein
MLNRAICCPRVRTRPEECRSVVIGLARMPRSSQSHINSTVQLALLLVSSSASVLLVQADSNSPNRCRCYLQLLSQANVVATCAKRRDLCVVLSDVDAALAPRPGAPPSSKGSFRPGRRFLKSRHRQQIAYILSIRWNISGTTCACHHLKSSVCFGRRRKQINVPALASRGRFPYPHLPRSTFYGATVQGRARANLS